MTRTALTPSEDKALKALIAWWEDAGLQLDEPVVRPRKPAEPRRAMAESAAQPFDEPVRPASPRTTPVRAATPAAAKAAGFGDRAAEGPASREIAAGCSNLEELRAAIEGFEGCALKRTARNTVFARGNSAAKIMIVGEAPGRDEDEQGLPFVGRSGKLLDRMFQSIGLGPDDVYISNIVNWRPPGNRNPTQEEITICLPLIERHIALKAPEILILTGGVSAQSLLRVASGITRVRGQWHPYAVKDPAGEPTGAEVKAMPLFHPSYLLRRPAEKRLAWADLLTLQAALG